MVEPKINRLVTAAGGECQTAPVGVAVSRQRSLSGNRGHITRRSCDRHRVGPGGGREGIQPVAVRGRRLANGIARAIRPGQGHRHPGDAGLAPVLDTVAIRIVPHIVTDGHRLVEPEINRRIAPTRRQRHRAAVGVAVVRGGSLAGRRRNKSRGRRHAHRVGAGRFREGIEPVTIRHGRGAHRATVDVRAGQGQGHPGDASFTRILHPVAVGVIPDEVANRHRRDHRQNAMTHGRIAAATIRIGDYNRIRPGHGDRNRSRRRRETVRTSPGIAERSDACAGSRRHNKGIALEDGTTVHRHGGYGINGQNARAGARATIAIRYRHRVSPGRTGTDGGGRRTKPVRAGPGICERRRATGDTRGHRQRSTGADRATVNQNTGFWINRQHPEAGDTAAFRISNGDIVGAGRADTDGGSGGGETGWSGPSIGKGTCAADNCSNQAEGGTRANGTAVHRHAGGGIDRQGTHPGGGATIGVGDRYTVNARGRRADRSGGGGETGGTGPGISKWPANATHCRGHREGRSIADSAAVDAGAEIITVAKIHVRGAGAIGRPDVHLIVIHATDREALDQIGAGHHRDAIIGKRQICKGITTIGPRDGGSNDVAASIQQINGQTRQTGTGVVGEVVLAQSRAAIQEEEARHGTGGRSAFHHAVAGADHLHRSDAADVIAAMRGISLDAAHHGNIDVQRSAGTSKGGGALIIDAGAGRKVEGRREAAIQSRQGGRADRYVGQVNRTRIANQDIEGNGTNPTATGEQHVAVIGFAIQVAGGREGDVAGYGRGVHFGNGTVGCRDDIGQTRSRSCRSRHRVRGGDVPGHLEEIGDGYTRRQTGMRVGEEIGRNVTHHIVMHREIGEGGVAGVADHYLVAEARIGGPLVTSREFAKCATTVAGQQAGDGFTDCHAGGTRSANNRNLNHQQLNRYRIFINGQNHPLYITTLGSPGRRIRFRGGNERVENVGVIGRIENWLQRIKRVSRPPLPHKVPNGELYIIKKRVSAMVEEVVHLLPGGRRNIYSRVGPQTGSMPEDKIGQIEIEIRIARSQDVAGVTNGPGGNVGVPIHTPTDIRSDRNARRRTAGNVVTAIGKIQRIGFINTSESPGNRNHRVNRVLAKVRGDHQGTGRGLPPA